MTIGQRIKQQRQARYWTKARLAQEAGTTTSVICVWESGKFEPSLSSFVKLCRAFHILMDEFMKGVDIR